MSFNTDEKVVDIVNELISCVDICIINKKIWETDKIKMITLIAQQKPEFYARRGRLIHSIVMYDDINTLVAMLKKFYLAQENKMDFQTLSNEVVMGINNKFATEATKEVLDMINSNNNSNNNNNRDAK